MNRNSLGVEMCSDKVNGKYVITAQTVDRTVELVRWLMDKYGIDVDHVVRHYDVTARTARSRGCVMKVCGVSSRRG